MYNNKAIKLSSRLYCKLSVLLSCLLIWLVLITGCSVKSNFIFPHQTGTLSAEIEGFHNDKGEAIVSLFSADEGFPDNMAKAWHNQRVKIDSGRASAIFESLPYGEYALCVLHDEDGDGRMKSSWLGQPLEGFGFSGRPDYKFGPPDYADAAFLLISESREIVVQLRYETARKEKQSQRRAGQYGKQ